MLRAQNWSGDEDPEGESDDEGWDEESSGDSRHEDAEYILSRKGKGKAKDMGEVGEIEMEVDQDFEYVRFPFRATCVPYVPICVF